MHLETMDREYIHPGHVGCPGCGAAIAMRFVLKALGEKTIMVMPACCWSIIAGPYPSPPSRSPCSTLPSRRGGRWRAGFAPPSTSRVIPRPR